jgi:oxygen-independent coproporphyrinogen-3 oxidase
MSSSDSNLAGYFEEEYERDVSLYLHIPFCKRRCLYCDFVTVSGKNHLIPSYLDALEKEIQEAASALPSYARVHTIYFGGGTPSLLPANLTVKLLDQIRSLFPVQEEMEITLEMNPGTLQLGFLEGLRETGVNRLSIGLQSAIDSELRSLGRIHNFNQFLETFASARKLGFENISVDLIYGIPGQTVDSWSVTLKKCLELEPSHLSLYSLNIEEETPFGRMVAEGALELPDGDLMADMYEYATDKLAERSFEQYEISNWASRKPDGSIHPSLHNLQYWRNLPYLGFGTGAHGSAGGVRTSNTTQIEDYLQRAASGEKKPYPLGFASSEWQAIDKFERMQETMMLGLRLTEEGLSEVEFARRYREDMRVIFGPELAKLENEGLLETLNDDRKTIRLTRRGRLLGNRVFMSFVGDPESK